MNEIAKRNAFDDDEYKMKKKKSKMKIANEKNSTNQNSLHDWINSRGIIFPNPINPNIDNHIPTSTNKDSFHGWTTINQNIDDYIPTSANQVSLHDWTISRKIIISETVNLNLEDCLPGSINRVSFHDWIINRGVTFLDPISHSELVNQKDVAILDLQNDVEKSILNHFRNTIFWHKNRKKKKKKYEDWN